MFCSVVIPTCNRIELLCNCLDLLDKKVQTVDGSSYEVLITDDSRVNSAKGLIESKYPAVTWLAGPKKGPAANRNNGAKHAKGEWLVFLDDDCLPKADILENYFLLIKENPDIQVFEGLVARERGMRSPVEKAPGNSGTKGGYLLSCNFAIKKDLFFKLEGFDENFKYPHLEDYDFKDRVVANNNKILFAVEAQVMHPYRRMSNGWNLGKFEEMSVYYDSKNGHTSNLTTLLKGIAASHSYKIIHFIKRKRFSIDLLTAVKIMFQHLTVVLFNFHKWNRKYNKQIVSK